jgi:nicotinamidase-related amidase
MKMPPPNRPAPKSITLDAATTAVVALDLSERFCDPAMASYPLIRPIGDFLARTRDASGAIIFTVVVWDKGTPGGAIAAALAPGADEPVIYPDGYDKFIDGDLAPILEGRGTKTLVFVGGSANFALLYTATAAARTHGYDVVIPLDGVYANSDYELEYALHQFTVLPRISDKFRFSTLEGISYR